MTAVLMLLGFGSFGV